MIRKFLISEPSANIPKNLATKRVVYNCMLRLGQTNSIFERMQQTLTTVASWIFLPSPLHLLKRTFEAQLSSALLGNILDLDIQLTELDGLYD